MPMLTPGRRVKHPGQYRARPGDLETRRYSPLGLTMRECPLCSHTHATHGTRPVPCPNLANHLRQRLNIDRGDHMFEISFAARSEAKLTINTLRLHHAAARDQIESGVAMTQKGNDALKALRERARRDGLAAELAELENPAPIKPIEREPASVRCRVSEGFATEYQNMIWDGAVGDVVLLPKGLAKPLARSRVVEIVGDDVPLFRMPRQWR
jgi:hypothetical protein